MEDPFCLFASSPPPSWYSGQNGRKIQSNRVWREGRPAKKEDLKQQLSCGLMIIFFFRKHAHTHSNCERGATPLL